MRKLTCTSLLILATLADPGCQKRPGYPSFTLPTGSSHHWPLQTSSIVVGTDTVFASVSGNAVTIATTEGFGRDWKFWQWRVTAVPRRDRMKPRASHLTDGAGDTDNDGVPDESDGCPEDSGLATTGCPDGIPPIIWSDQLSSLMTGGDRDNDGVPDSIDSCPDDSGSVANQGCPDGDGIPPIVWNDVIIIEDSTEVVVVSLGYPNPRRRPTHLQTENP